jgi:hypothetical protein
VPRAPLMVRSCQYEKALLVAYGSAVVQDWAAAILLHLALLEALEAVHLPVVLLVVILVLVLLEEVVLHVLFPVVAPWILCHDFCLDDPCCGVRFCFTLVLPAKVHANRNCMATNEQQ